MNLVVYKGSEYVSELKIKADMRSDKKRDLPTLELPSKLPISPGCQSSCLTMPRIISTGSCSSASGLGEVILRIPMPCRTDTRANINQKLIKVCLEWFVMPKRDADGR